MCRTRRGRSLCTALLGAAAIVLLSCGPAIAVAQPTAPVTGHVHDSPAVPVKPLVVAPGGAVNPAGRGRVVPKRASMFDGQVLPQDVTWAVTLAANYTNLAPMQYTQLVATASRSVDYSPYFVSIYDTTASVLVAACGNGTTCTASVTSAIGASHDYAAVVSPKPDPTVTGMPSGIRAASSPVTVNWTTFSVSLAVNPTTVELGSATTVTATSNVDVGTSPFYTEIYDVTSDSLVAVCATGATCAGTRTSATATTDAYVAYVAPYSPLSLPSAPQALSAAGYVTWSDAGFTISLTTAVGSATATVVTPASPGPYVVEIFDETAGGPPIQVCGSATTCTATTSTSGDQLVAFVTSTVDSAPPPPISPVASSQLAETED